MVRQQTAVTFQLNKHSHGGAPMNRDRQNDHPTANIPSAPRPAVKGRERMTARPAVLRALTDLFCLRNDPIDEEVERFRELALQIIPDAGPSTRLYVAAKLARHPLAPRDVLVKLAENDPPCATLLLEHARNFPMSEQVLAAINGDRSAAVALASRPSLAAPVSEALVARNDPHVTRALADNPNAEITSAAVEAVKRMSRPDRIYAGKLEAKAPAPFAAPEGFLAAPPTERMRLIAVTRRATLGQATTPITRDEALISDLKDSAVDRNWIRFSVALSRKTGLPTDVVDRLIRDDGGEPLALLLCLIGANPAEAVRILLCCDATIAHSYKRVRDLSLIVEDTPATAAGALIFGMTGARPRISTYADTPERRTAPLVESARAVDVVSARSGEERRPKTQVVLRRQIR